MFESKAYSVHSCENSLIAFTCDFIFLPLARDHHFLCRHHDMNQIARTTVPVERNALSTTHGSFQIEIIPACWYLNIFMIL